MFVNIIREMINFEPGKVIDGLVFSCETSHQTSLTVESLWRRGRALELGNPKVWGSILHGESEFFLCFTLVTRRKNVPRYIIITLPDKISWDTSPEQRLWSSSTLYPIKCCWLPMFLCHLAEPTHYYSCQTTKSRLHTPISTVVHAEVVCAPKFLPISIFLSHTLRSKITAP